MQKVNKKISLFFWPLIKLYLTGKEIKKVFEVILAAYKIK